MKNKILFRLISYFVTSFIIFAFIIGVIFTLIFSQNNMDVHKTTLDNRAVAAADTLSGMLENNVKGQAKQGTGFGAYLRYIEDISMNEVWVVDRDLQPITCGQETHTDHEDLLNKELPVWAAEIVLRAIREEALVSESFSTYAETPSICAAMPIVLQSGKVIGAVLLHSHVSDVTEATHNGVMILVLSMSVAVIISVFVAALLSSRFTKPLSKMKEAAVQISNGDYSVRTDVEQSDEIGELASAMDDMVNRLGVASQEHQTLEKMRQDFIANISHELRTPVTVIRGSLEALCDDVVSDSGMVKEYHNQMLIESVYLERLVSDLLDLARLQNTDFAMEMDRVDLKNIAQDATRSIRRVAAERNVDVCLSCVGEHFVVYGDYGRLRQMLLILLNNAVKFSPEGGKVLVSLSAGQHTITLAVRDQGPGIAPEDLPHIFERFYRQRSEENKSGTGLGLAIAKQIADRHGATVNVKSKDRLEKGCEFSLTIDKVD